MTDPQAFRGSGPEDAPDRVSLVALVTAFIVGPLGVALGAWALSRIRQSGRKGRGLATAAIAVGLIQTVALVGWGAGFVLSPATPGESESGEPVPTWTYPSTPPPSGPVESPSQTPAPPAATSLEEFIPPAVDNFEQADFEDDSDTLDAGATEAQQGTFTSGDDVIGVQMSQWPTAEDASRHAQESAARDFDAASMLTSGSIRSGSGQYWYYEKDGQATVYWYDGTFSAQFSGKPMEVQEFFLRFPK